MEPGSSALRERFRNLIDTCPSQAPQVPMALHGNIGQGLAAPSAIAAPTIPHQNVSNPAETMPAPLADAAVVPTSATNAPPAPLAIDYKLVVIAVVVIVAVGFCLFSLIPKKETRDKVDDSTFEDAMAEFRKKKQAAAARPSVQEYEDEDVEDDDEYVAPPPAVRQNANVRQSRSMQRGEQASITASRQKIQMPRQEKQQTRVTETIDTDDPMFQLL